MLNTQSFEQQELLIGVKNWLNATAVMNLHFIACLIIISWKPASLVRRLSSSSVSSFSSADQR